MIPIGPTLPADNGSFIAALAYGLAPLGVDAAAVRVEGAFPKLDLLRVDLTGARLHRGLRASQAAGERAPLCFARVVEAGGAPVHAEMLPAQFSLRAEDVVLVAADAEAGAGKVLAFGRAGSGTFEISAKRADLEQAMFSAAQEAASSKGAEVKSVDLALESRGPRAVAARATVTAKAMFFTTSVVVSGVIEVDDELNARVRGLDCEGEGMIGKMAAGALRSQFEKIEQQVVPLGRAVAGLRLRDVTLEAGEVLRIRGNFAANA